MDTNLDTPPHAGSRLAWAAAALIGAVAPAAMLALLAGDDAPAGLAAAAAPLVAAAMMGAGMIGAATDGRFRIGAGLAAFAGAVLVLLSRGLGISTLTDPLAAVLALALASVSFAARGALFARSGGKRGWWIAAAVFGGEAAMLATAWAMPGSLPAWLLALLPAQWASMALRAGLTGAGTLAAGGALLALAGTAGTTLLVARLWPRRWPYLVMFTAWLALSALVMNWPFAPSAALAVHS